MYKPNILRVFWILRKAHSIYCWTDFFYRPHICHENCWHWADISLVNTSIIMWKWNGEKNYGFAMTLKESQTPPHSHHQLVLANEGDQHILDKKKKWIWFSIPTDVISETLGMRPVSPRGCYLVLPILQITGGKSQADIRCPNLHLKGWIIKLL